MWRQARVVGLDNFESDTECCAPPGSWALSAGVLMLMFVLRVRCAPLPEVPPGSTDIRYELVAATRRSWMLVPVLMEDAGQWAGGESNRWVAEQGEG